MSDEMRTRKLRWRLVLGEGSEGCCGDLAGEWARRDAALGWLYGREYGAGRNVRQKDRTGGLGDSALTVPDWINAVHTLFPKRTIERLEKDALERYGIEDMVTNPELLARAEPSMTLLKAVLHTKHLMNAEVLALARDMVRRVVEELLKKLARPVRNPFQGSRDRQRRSFLKISRNFDAKRTIRRNLKHFDPSSRKLVVQDPVFVSRVRSLADKWRLIIVVDQSGSMTDSAIHSAVTASIFWGIRSLKTHLILFDTNIVDVTEHCSDPVETLMKIQLGGGTDIGGALAYAAGLIDNPRRTIVVLITDFFEGGDPAKLLGITHKLTSDGVKLLGLAALDDRADPAYDRDMAGRMVNLGAHVAAMTPGELAAWVGEKVG